ncbi:recombinase family protein [Siccirubricoccus sp. KC 17139]|uniref:Recombinase family protein n=1 Tax=Siccirubricoccus soli TaxID=2899147 RepID=A0ABT1D1B9_9PROT|nr:recombinase family protein [Siccirubricoccus soli]MCO6415693.1 recombinase family protein [Siccirubricoccus soli]MCP2681825.1 recombinase family protein [Siccirubricoccus soli]
MSVYGYVRAGKSWEASTAAEQRAEIASAARRALMEITEIFEDYNVHRDLPLEARPGGAAALSTLTAGDTLFVANLNRAFKDPSDALAVIGMLKEKCVNLIVLGLGTAPVTSPAESHLVSTLLSAVAAFHSPLPGRQFRYHTSTLTRLREIAAEMEALLGFHANLPGSNDSPAALKLKVGELPPAPFPPDMLLTQDEAAARLRISKKTLYRLRAAGKVRFLPGRPVKLIARDVEALIADNTVKNPVPQPPRQLSPTAQVRLMRLRDRIRRTAKKG